MNFEGCLPSECIFSELLILLEVRTSEELIEAGITLPDLNNTAFLKSRNPPRASKSLPYASERSSISADRVATPSQDRGYTAQEDDAMPAQSSSGPSNSITNNTSSSASSNMPPSRNETSIRAATESASPDRRAISAKRPPPPRASRHVLTNYSRNKMPPSPSPTPFANVRQPRLGPRHGHINERVMESMIDDFLTS